MAQHVDQQVAVGRDAVQAGAAQRVGQDRRGPPPGRRPGDDLGQHRVVEDRHLRTVHDAGVDAHAHAAEGGELGPCGRHVEAVHRARLRLPVLGGILGVEPHLDRMPLRRRRFGGRVRRRPRRAAAARRGRSPVVSSVTGCSTCSRVFISRKKKSPASSAMNSTVPAPVYPMASAASRAASKSLARMPVRAFDERRRGLLDDLLVAALDRALAFADRPHRAVRVGHHLDLDVVAGGEVALAEHRRVAERGLRLALGGLDLLGQVGQVADDAHAAAAATGRRLDQHRQLRRGDGVGVEFVEHGHPRGGHHLLGLDLGAHRLHGGDGRPDPRQPRLLHGAREFGVLREESVPGVDGVGARRAGRRDQLGGVEVAVAAVEAYPGVGLGHVGAGGVGFGVDGDGADAEPTAGGEHAPGDLAAVGNQNSRDHAAPPRFVHAQLRSPRLACTSR